MRIKTTLVAAALLAANIAGHAQLSESWNLQMDGPLQFQTVTATGSYLVSTSNSLSSYDMDNGQQLWSIASLAGITEDQVQEVPGSPLLLIRKGSEVNIVDPYAGSIKFNSADAGFTELKYEQMLYKTNGILVAGNKGDQPAMMLVDLTSGKSRWELDEKFGKLITVEEFSDSEMLVVALMNAYRIKSSDGSIVWKKSTSAESEAMQDAGALGALFQGMAEELAEDYEFVTKYYENKKQGIFIIAAEEKIENAPIGNREGDPTITYKNNYTAFNKKDGSRIWDKSVTMDGKLGDLAFYDNGVIILPDDGNKTLINYFDFESSEGKWGNKGKGTKIKGGVYSHIATPKGLLLISGTGSNTFLTFLDPSTGELTFDKPVKASGQVMKTFESPKGLAFVTTGEFDILNTATGELVLDKSINTTPGLVEQKGDELFIFDTKGSNIVKVNLADGSTTAVTEDKLKFDGKESPQKLELRDNGILLSSEQNLALYSYSGEQQFLTYHKAPGESGLKKALLVAQAVRAAYIGANAYAAAGTLQAAAPQVSEEDAVGGAMVEGFGMMYEELGNAASDFAKESLKRATTRFKASTESRDFIIMLGEVDKKNALLKVNKNTGEVDAMVDLGKEKEPKYAVDDVSGKIFNVAEGNKIASYDF